MSELTLKYYIVCALGASVLLIIESLLIPALALVFSLFFFLIIEKKKEIIFIFVIVSSLVLTTTIDPTLRTIIQFLNYTLLSFIFLKRYEFQYQHYPRPPKVLIVYLSTLVLVMLISTFFSSHVYLGLSQIGRMILFFYLIYLLYALIVDEIIIKVYLIALFVVALIYLFFLVYELSRFDFNLLLLNLNGFDNNGSSYVHKNALGSFFVLIVLLLISFSLYEKYSLYKRMINLLILIFVSGLIITNARAAIISLVAGAVFIIYTLKRKYLKYFMILLITPTILYFLFPIQKYLDLYFRFERVATGRDFILLDMWEVIKNNWLIGAGPAGTRYEMYKGIPYMLGSPEELYLRHHYAQIEFGHAHNFYLFFFTDLGIMGLLLSILLPIIFFKISLKTIAFLKKEKIENYYLAIGITAFGIAIFIRGLFEWGGIISYGTIGYDFPFWVLFSIQMFLFQKHKIEIP